MTTKARLSLICAAMLMIFAAVACGGSTTSRDATSSPTAAVSSASSAASVTTAPTVAKVSANTASESEIEEALRNAGVSNPERWAEEVVEYRPYPTDDPNLTKLRENLAKYNPGQETIDKIISALTP